MNRLGTIKSSASLPALLMALLLTLFFTFFSSLTVAAILPSPPQLAATSYILVDADTGKVIVNHQADTRVPPASLTKIMTAYLVSSQLESGQIALTDQVPISVKAWKMGGSKMFIREGTEVQLEDLMRGMIIQSGNDASVAVAEYIGGDEFGFAEMMNQQAEILGMTDTNFINATGLPDQGHYTTAADLALLTRNLIKNFPDVYSFYSEREFTYNDITQQNRNGLLWKNQYVDGVKTGHTNEAGYCLVSSAKRDGMRLISVVTGTKSKSAREQESQKLLGYGFRHFESKQIYSSGDQLNLSQIWGGKDKELSLVIADDIRLTLPKGQAKQLQAEVSVDNYIEAPVSQGDIFGKLTLVLEGEVISQHNLVAASDVEQSGLLSRLWDKLVYFIYSIIGLV